MQELSILSAAFGVVRSSMHTSRCCILYLISTKFPYRYAVRRATTRAGIGGVVPFAPKLSTKGEKSVAKLPGRNINCDTHTPLFRISSALFAFSVSSCKILAYRSLTMASIRGWRRPCSYRQLQSASRIELVALPATQFPKLVTPKKADRNIIPHPRLLSRQPGIRTCGRLQDMTRPGIRGSVVNRTSLRVSPGLSG